MLFAALIPSGIWARGVTSIADALDSVGNVALKVEYQVTMPSFSEPVNYSVTLAQAPSAADTLAPCAYLIDWTLRRPNGDSHGWSAYFNGNHYRMLNQRLQEYHAGDNPAAFGIDNVYSPQGGVKAGVQSNAQFTDLLPAFIAHQIRDTANDSTYTYTLYTDTIISGTHRKALRAIRQYQGYDVRDWLLVLDTKTSLPVMLSIENNPGSISEQSITATFSPIADPSPIPLDEQSLAATYPDDFERYRQSTFRIENLPGVRLPSFSARTSDGRRYNYQRKQSSAHPLLIAFLDSEQGDPATTAQLIRNGVDQLPRTIDTIWAFTDNNAERAINAIGPTRPGETLLLNCSSLARDCGISATPILILVNTDGTVNDVIVGFNNNLDSIVIQQASLL